MKNIRVIKEHKNLCPAEPIIKAGSHTINTSSHSPERRLFLGRVSGTAAATMAASVVGLSPFSETKGTAVEAAEVGPRSPQQRRNRAYRIRHEAAINEKEIPLPAHPTNGDEELYTNKIGSYSKGLPHNSLGEVDLNAYSALVHAMATGNPADFEAIPLGGTVKLADPQAAFAYEMDGADSHHIGMIAPPPFSSEEQGGEMAEVYWHALARDVPFSQYGTEPLTIRATGDLSNFSIFSGVNASNLFRGNTPGDLTGPYLSQFLWKPIPFGATTITQQYQTTVDGDNHLATYDAWLNCQNGFAPATSNKFDPTPRYIRNGRDLAEYVHKDFSYQAFLSAGLILLGLGPQAVDDANPYKSAAKQSAFVTFGGPHILDLVARVANSALKAAWYQKWSVHRRLRPEAYAGNLHNHKTGAAAYPIHPKLLNSQALAGIFDAHGTYLLPMAYPEGCPTHPAYPAGHAAIAGAGVTVLKAYFKESFPIPNPVMANDDGLSLGAYSGPALTIGGELNKLASNIGIGRDVAGVHWRSDCIEGLKLGEAVAISILRDYAGTFNESFGGFSLTRFDGTTITVG
jgi:membrane-associated phospholipid phosphatase